VQSFEFKSLYCLKENGKKKSLLCFVTSQNDIQLSIYPKTQEEIFYYGTSLD
jgi:hypothetical protein